MCKIYRMFKHLNVLEFFNVVVYCKECVYVRGYKIYNIYKKCAIFTKNVLQKFTKMQQCHSPHLTLLVAWY